MNTISDEMLYSTLHVYDFQQKRR